MTRLSEAGDKFEEALIQRAIAMHDLRIEVRKARLEGISITEISRQAQLTRQTVYEILKEKP